MRDAPVRFPVRGCPPARRFGDFRAVLADLDPSMDDPGALTEAERETIVVATGAADHRLFAMSSRLAGAGNCGRTRTSSRRRG